MGNRKKDAMENVKKEAEDENDKREDRHTQLSIWRSAGAEARMASIYL